MRHYIETPAQADKVPRMVTVGTPYWGSPKTIFPLAAGEEAPMLGPMDVLMSNSGLKAASRTFPGHFSLVPAFGYGPWLSVAGMNGGRPLDMDGVRAYLGRIGVNPSMYTNGAAEHGRVLDHYADNGIDFHVIVGGGVPTIGAVGIGHGVLDSCAVEWVTRRQDRADVLGREDTPRDRLHVVCGVEHVPITADPQTTKLMDEFLIRGEKIRDGRTDCEWTARATVVLLRDSLTATSSQAKTQPRVIPAAARTRCATPSGRASSGDHVRRRRRRSWPRATCASACRGGTAAIVRELSDRGAGAPKHYVGAKPVAKDTKAPVTKASWRRGKLVLKAKDASKVAATFVVIGGKPRVYKRPLKLSAKQRKGAKYGSVDVWGNAERERPIRSR